MSAEEKMSAVSFGGTLEIYPERRIAHSASSGLFPLLRKCRALWDFRRAGVRRDDERRVLSRATQSRRNEEAYRESHSAWESHRAVRAGRLLRGRDRISP